MGMGMGTGRDLSGAVVIDPTATVDEKSTFGDHSLVGRDCEVVESTCGRFTFLYGDIRMVHTQVKGFA